MRLIARGVNARKNRGNEHIFFLVTGLITQSHTCSVSGCAGRGAGPMIVVVVVPVAAEAAAPAPALGADILGR